MATTTKLRGNAIIGLTIFNAQIATTAGIAYTKLAAITDGNSYYSGTNVDAALDEISNQLGGATSTTFNFTEANVLTDNDAVYAALEKLDLEFGDLASTSNAEGASLVGVEDSGGNFTGTDVEAVLAELQANIIAVSTGTAWKDAVEVKTVGALSGETYDNGSSGVGATLTAAVGIETIDGIQVIAANFSTGDRILVTEDGVSNNSRAGIYTITVLSTAGLALVLTRATDNDQTGEFSSAATFVKRGRYHTVGMVSVYSSSNNI